MNLDKERTPVEVEESVLEGNSEEEAIPSIAEDKVQIISPPAPTQQTLMFFKNLQDSAPSYNKVRTKRPCSSIGTLLKCEKHPFFEDSLIFQKKKSFYNNIFSVEGNIF